MSTPLTTKLKREVQKSPGKAAMLALLLAVALWFWAPLLMGMFGSSAGNTAVAGSPATATKTPAANAAAGSAAAVNVPFQWREVVEQIEHDPLMRPAKNNLRVRDVFQPVAPTQPVENKIAEVTPPPVAPQLDIPPQTVGLSLSSTIIGPTRRVARMNGHNYQPGDTVEVTTDQGPLNYVLTAVADRSVTLTLGQHQYELPMPKRPLGTTPAQANDFVSSDDANFDPSILESE
jgi:hypothetical protein